MLPQGPPRSRLGQVVIVKGIVVVGPCPSKQGVKGGMGEAHPFWDFTRSCWALAISSSALRDRLFSRASLMLSFGLITPLDFSARFTWRSKWAED